ncbi:MAG TPA: hypothetical protein VF865_06125 [Acidobacteriaceae bacterium]
MDYARGILMLALGVFALYRGFVMMHARQSTWMPFGLGALAIAIGIWRLTRKPPKPRI